MSSVYIPSPKQLLSGKADKVNNATTGNFASLDSNGNLMDSGHKHSDYLTSHQDITGKADKVTSATSGNFASLDSNGNLVDSGHKHSDYATIASVLREVPFSITTTDWTSGNDGYTATVTTAYVTSSSKEFVQFDQSIRLAHSDITTSKVQNGGGVVFTTGSIPAGTITGNIYTIGDEDGKTTVLVENAFIIKPFEVELDAISDASGAYSHTTTDSRVTEAMKPISIEYGNPAAFLSPVTVATGNGTITLTCSNVVGSSTVKVTVLPTQSIDWAQSAPTTITSAEADILADRIDSNQVIHRGIGIGNADLDAITTPGRYYAGDASTLTNGPSGLTNVMSADLFVTERAADSRVWQILFIYNGSYPVMWFRVMTGASSWTAWSELASRMKTVTDSTTGVTFATNSGTISSATMNICYNNKTAFLNIRVRIKDPTIRPTITVSGLPADIPYFRGHSAPCQVRMPSTSGSVASDPFGIVHVANAASFTMVMENYIGACPAATGGYIAVVASVAYGLL